MSAPAAAAVLVGRSPTPALLSSLTLAADRLALIASDDTLSVARRVAEAAARVGPPRSVRVLSAGPDPHDFRAVTRCLEDWHHTSGGGAWSLDYTGGTKVMSVAAALLHAHLHPGRAARWRYYLDATADALRPADGTHPALPLSCAGVDLAVLAGLHGARWLADRDPEPIRLFVQGGAQALTARRPDLSPAVRRGVVAEGRVLSHLRRHLRRQSEAEVLGPRQVADPLHPAASVADFDAVVRYRHRVLCVEAKTRPGDVVARAGWTVAKARRVFGTAAQVLFVHTGPADPALRKAITGYNPALSARLVHVWSLDDLLNRLASFDDLRKAFFPGTGRPAAAPAPGARPAPRPPAPHLPPPEHHPGPGDGPLLVTPLGGSRVGALTALHAHRPSRALILPSRQSLRDNVRTAAARALRSAEHPGAGPADPARLKEEGYRDRVRLPAEPVDGSDAEAVADLAREWITSQTAGPEGVPPAIVDVTTGTKAMSLGLALAAQETGACAVYQLPGTREVVCAAHGRIPLKGRAAVDWPLALTGYTPIGGPLAEHLCPPARGQVDAPLLDAARTALVRAAGGPVGVWADASLTDPRGCLSAQERPSLVLTFDDRAVGLAAPAWHRRRPHGGGRHPVTRGAWAQSVFAATTHLQLRCDVAGKVIALTRPGGDAGRARELVDWITGAGTAEADPEPRLSFGEPLRPLVVDAAPGALPALLHTDASRL
ncbi:CRISPR-associated protein [Nocardiopsis sp. CNT312]|uniref:CRISPR-associated protein n=1 Tax=Nocardiopsis sp. CNT312 TaxID=1137268 RepID=UPI00048CB1D8|nr:CRISPR-associated protein [Nocardiopsis sp. CNT312]